MVNLTQAIKRQAYQLGFTLVGITTPDPLPHADVFEAWLDQGRHAEMTYLSTLRSRVCRARPQMILPECRSVIVLGMRYPAHLGMNSKAAGDSLPRGRIASYAWGEDYHEILPARLRSLVAFIESMLGHSISNRWYTDTGPLMERELAMRAGLGWIGKNTCLINPHMGSYFLLAEVLLEVELEPDLPFSTDRCGTCQRCISACPTGCIMPDRILDAGRCISYLTIELKGSIPPELRPLMGNWVFGCDVCQQVCPWNRFAAAQVDPVFELRLTQPDPNLLDEVTLQTADFNRKYRTSPLRRTRRRGYLRNIAVALGNLRNPGALPGLIRLVLHEEEPLVRSHAAWALGQIGGSQAMQTIEQVALTESDPGVKLEIQAALRTH